MTNNHHQEIAMVDLSGLSLAELTAAVEEEKSRRKYAAISELRAVAERYGYTLEELTGAKRKYNEGRKGIHLKRPHGVARDMILSGLRAGKHVEEVAKDVGWANSGGVYAYARKYGVKVSHGRAVL